ncbi:MAG: hypothetical protein ACSHWU_13735, partial [Marinicella sp.]
AGTDNAELVVPVLNIIDTWNELASVNSNLTFGGDNNVPFSQFDWESTVLHEVGHCIGLAHPNLGSQTGVSGVNTNYTNSTDGVDDEFDFNDGSDNIIGSDDDLRDDDQNLFWFNDAVNNPFVLSPPYGASNYTRDLIDLPGGDNYAANPDRAVGAALGFTNSEAVMQQGTFNDEAQRQLGADDEATLRLAMSGADEIQGNADDYTIVLSYGGIASGCDININNDPTYTGFAVCGVGGTFVNGTHVAITTASIRTNPSSNWFFNPLGNDLIFEDGFE